MKSLLKRYLPSRFWRQLQLFKRVLLQQTARCVRVIFERCGFVVARKSDYYSPLPSESQLRKTYPRWARPSPLRGVTYDLDAMKTRLKALKDCYYDEFLTLPPYPSLVEAGYGPGYTHVDAFTLYAMMRQLQPGRYLEIGSGLSTYYCHLARQRNREQGHDTKMVCIEPYPYSKLSEIEQIDLIPTEVQEVPLKTFESLGSGDVLFIDSSHVLRLDGDVSYIFLEALPVIAAGVYVHVHDIPFPFNIPYPPDYWTLLQNRQSPRWPMYWNEAMLLQAFLAFNPSFEIVLSCAMIRHFDESFMRAILPIYKPLTEEPNTFSSIWLKRIQ
jgi:hypothetical protein